MPIVRVAQAMKDVPQGDTLEVIANDPAFHADLDAWSRKTGNPVQWTAVDDDADLRAVIEKAV